MGLLQKLLSTIGLRDSGSDSGGSQSGETTVTVEREPNVSSEAAVKGTDEGTTSTAAGSTMTVTETEATADAESSDATRSSPAEPAESSSPDTRETGGRTSTPADATVERGADDEPDPAVTDEEPDEAADEEPVEELEQAVESDANEPAGANTSPDALNGIGPAYAARLENAGVETVADLATADAADLAAETDLGEGRISNWIEQAREF